MSRLPIAERLVMKAIRDLQQIPEYKKGLRARQEQERALLKELGRLQRWRFDLGEKRAKRKAREGAAANPHLGGSRAYAEWEARERGREEYLARLRPAESPEARSKRLEAERRQSLQRELTAAKGKLRAIEQAFDVQYRAPWPNPERMKELTEQSEQMTRRIEEISEELGSES